MSQALDKLSDHELVQRLRRATGMRPVSTDDDPIVLVREFLRRFPDLEFELRSYPLTKVTVLRADLEAWLTKHAHRDKYHGAIGGHLSMKQASTSLGVMESHFCYTCRESCWVDDEF